MEWMLQQLQDGDFTAESLKQVVSVTEEKAFLAKETESKGFSVVAGGSSVRVTSSRKKAESFPPSNIEQLRGEIHDLCLSLVFSG